LLGPLQAGDPSAVRQLWQGYFPRLVGLARQKLQGSPRRVADEEDVALSAFGSFCRAAEAGRFPDLLDRDSLWRLLVVFTARKAAHLRRDQGRPKRCSGRPVHSGQEGEDELKEVLSREPSPELVAELVEECRRLLARLGDPELEAVAVARMEGHSVEELAERFGYSSRSIKRKLRMIRDLWSGEVPT
jgi:DNA-directed RNA polymerase specialized sigma24 family protein